MNQLEKVKSLEPVEYESERVLTTAQLAELFETETDNLKCNFRRNQGRFIEGKHFYKLEGQALQDFKNSVANCSLVQKNTPSLYLWTERGAMRHSKMLNTDVAWDMFELLEENYFNHKKPMTMEEVIAQSANALVEHKRQLRKLESEQHELKSLQEKQSAELETLNKRIDNLNGTNIEGTPRQIVNSLVRAYALKAGIEYRQAWKEAYQAYNIAYHANLKSLAQNYAKRNNLKSCSKLDYLEYTDKTNDLIQAVDRLINNI